MLNSLEHKFSNPTEESGYVFVPSWLSLVWDVHLQTSLLWYSTQLRQRCRAPWEKKILSLKQTSKYALKANEALERERLFTQIKE